MATDSMDKIRLKGAPKDYKTGKPGLSGRGRLERTARSLLLQAHRFAQKKGTGFEDEYWARNLVLALQGVLGVSPTTEVRPLDRPRPPAASGGG